MFTVARANFFLLCFSKHAFSTTKQFDMHIFWLLAVIFIKMTS